ncbi:MAG: hypothetical protein M3461_13120 [Pseudomonadota bacterium]|nr:hypothetical protein [Pseudomonadota bacterium]
MPLDKKGRYKSLFTLRKTSEALSQRDKGMLTQIGVRLDGVDDLPGVIAPAFSVQIPVFLTAERDWYVRIA